MAPGIFISYSREDEKHAMHLLALLRREGYSVWIDQEAIAGASIWSDEIVQNIKSSQIFIALLSAASVNSANVAKEIALAAEHGKIILPIEIGAVQLPGRLEYALAGIQRTNFHEVEAILHAVRSQVARLEGVTTDAQSVSRTRHRRSRRSAIIAAVVLLAVGTFLFFRRPPAAAAPDNLVYVLPFSTLNLDRDSTRNLDIFSDALTSRLAAQKTLWTVGRTGSSTYKDSPLNAMAIAKELKARFIIEGLVRKMHDVNFVSARIIDTKQGGEIWEQSYSGNNSELFATRERLCSDLFGYLHYVTGEEAGLRAAEQNLKAHPNDAAAYAHVANMLIGSDKNRSLELFEQAIKFDSSNASYYLGAGIVAGRLGNVGRTNEFGRAAIGLLKRNLMHHPDSLNLSTTYAIALDMAGRSAEAERAFDSLLHLHPTDVRLTYNAACCIAKQGKTDGALDLLDRLFTLAPGKKGEVQSDRDFDNIRSNPRYQRLMYGEAQ
ncbi:MAG: TIR domain-containing protein [Bacteroidota bacterium]|nr:TIR domain-containing protein [Bacteroidota bacterium]MDP4234275.1 TIR domain-containing protein [Bacteroidota bacterium]MDP4243465.1 TIR domain-containing protein [Bacteroidota bacterium]MDP4289167.1 TIR domain-containing protein [Bacteroidota bacterium]